MRRPSRRALRANCPRIDGGPGSYMSYKPRGVLYSALLIALLLIGCGGGDTVTPAATATQTPHPSGTPISSATPTPSPTVVVTYRLTEGSTIFSSQAPPEAPVAEPLSGTFVIAPRPKGGPFCLNTILCLAVVAFQFQSPHFIVAGSDGQIEQTTLQPNAVSMGLTSSINGQPIGLSGSGPFDPNSSFPPAFSALEMCGAPPGVGGSCAGIRTGTDVGYDLIVFAAPGD